MSLLTYRPALSLFFVLVLIIVLSDTFLTKKINLPQSKQLWEGRVVSYPETNTFGQQFVLYISALKTKVKLSVLIPQENINPGDTIQFESKLTPPTNYKNPGAFDYASYLRRQGITYVATVTDEAHLSIQRKPGAHWPRYFHQKSLTLFDELNFSADIKGIMVALIWGDESYLNDSLKDLFREAGLYHLLVISGLHFTALLVCVYFLVKFLLSFKPQIYLYLPGDVIPAIVSIFVVTAYYFLCVEGASIQRAYLVSLVLCGAILIRRQLDFLNLLFLVACVMAFLNPFIIYDISFQFSFLAVLSLVLILPKLETLIKKPVGSIGYKQILVHGRTLLLATIAIFFGLTPLSVFYFHHLQCAGFVMNLWAVPLLEFLVTPLLILAFFIAPIWPLLARYLYLWCDQCILLAIKIIKFLSGFLPSDYLVMPPHGWELILYYVALFVVISAASKKIKWRLALASIFIITMGETYLLIDQKKHVDLRYHQIDVGQGDATLLEIPGGQKVLIDTGGSAYTDIASRAVLPYFNYKRWRHIDGLFITHDDLDHLGAANSLLDVMSVSKIYWNGRPNPSEHLVKLLNRGIPSQILTQDDELVFGACRVYVLAPDQNLLIAKNDNDASLVLKWQCPGASVLLSGDLSSKAEYQLLLKNENQFKSLVFKLGHHGSKSSNDFQFIRAINPKIALVSAKKYNHFGHPHPDVLKRLEALEIPLLRTDTEGLIVLSLENDKVARLPGY